MRCSLCNRNSKTKLCRKHNRTYVWDSKLQGFRLKKRNTGSRYTQANFHKAETNLVKLIEHIYGKSKVYTSYHPKWALSPKNVLYEYDIYVPSENLLIEYNGRQHYEFVPFFHKTMVRFKRQQQRDKLKSQLAETHGCRLVTFKHDEPITKNFVTNKVRG